MNWKNFSLGAFKIIVWAIIIYWIGHSIVTFYLDVIAK